MKIPVSAIVVTKNEERHIAACLSALKNFSEIIVVDSSSTDQTTEIAKSFGARVENFQWNGKYPKKRQWCLDNLKTEHDWIFFVDADEIITPALMREIAALDFSAAGYFVPGAYIFEDAPLKFGLRNRKLALINRSKMKFPVIDDLAIEGMGEIEGHYQPVLKARFSKEKIGTLKNPLLHDAYADKNAWRTRHERYAQWEVGMDKRRAWPDDPRPAKKIFRALPFRGAAAFLHSYILKCGFLDGARGLRFAQSRKYYYDLVQAASRKRS